MSRRGEALGREAEALARGLLERGGMRVAASRLRTGGGELDLVAWDGATLVFVEVKARSNPGHGRPEEAVDRKKRERLTAAAGAYLAGLSGPAPACRFDVVAVDFGQDGPVVRHLPDAFRPGD
ncbi:MAG: YraN family protein [Desulfarculaceae bacterium]|nr:YraN family protein [Desulfarculaceae bacterium]